VSTIKRYKKPGGFRQLLTLVETSPTAKREQLLKIVETEDATWADELRKRMITATKYFTWSPEAIEKVVQTIPHETWPKALFSLPAEERQKLFTALIKFMPHTKQKDMVLYMEGLKPSMGEVESAQIFIVKKMREMQANGDFKPERFDPNLTLEGLDKLLAS
jgi:flagellar motor switch protein FliG